MSRCALVELRETLCDLIRALLFTRSVHEDAKHARAGKKREEERERKRLREGGRHRAAPRARHGRSADRSGAPDGRHNGIYGAPDGRHAARSRAPRTGARARMLLLFIQGAWMPVSQLVFLFPLFRDRCLANFAFHRAAFSASVRRS